MEQPLKTCRRHHTDKELQSLFDAVPADVIKHILTVDRTFTVDDIKAACRVSKRFSELCNTRGGNNVWDIKFKALFGDDAYAYTMDNAERIGYDTMTWKILQAYKATLKDIGNRSSVDFPSLIVSKRFLDKSDFDSDFEEQMDEAIDDGLYNLIGITLNKNYEKKQTYTISVTFGNEDYVEMMAKEGADEAKYNFRYLNDSVARILRDIQRRVQPNDLYHKDYVTDDKYYSTRAVPLDVARKYLLRLYISLLMNDTVLVFEDLVAVKINSDVSFCSSCFTAPAVNQCNACGVATFCTHECAERDWQQHSGHRDVCQLLSSRRRLK